MGNCVSLSLPLDQSVNKVSQWLEKKGGYTRNLKKNLVALETTMKELKARRDDLSRRLTREEDRGLQRLAEFQLWLNRVEKIEKEVTDILSARNVELQRLCLCGFFSKTLMSSYRYGKSVILKLREVEKLKCSGVFDVIAEKALTPEVEERQLQPTIVGQEIMLEKTWKHLMEDGVGIMGMYGMGGVGKTTLLTQLNNKFSSDRCGFDFVIWVVVSKELHIEKILDDIARKVDLDEEEWKGKEKSQKVDVIYNFLKKKKFVLFLDDIWEKVNLADIGVPFPTIQNRCKVAFTTRSHDVCRYMGVEDSMEVQCLANDDAFDLFQKKVGNKTLGSDPELLDLAKIVAKKCCGLPLALNVIGETMSCKKTIQEWHHAIDVLTSSAIEFSCMEDKILPLLKYSYDSLKGEQIRSCLLHCALFPEDYKIPKEILVEYWICQGIIDGSEDIEKAENKGYDIIGSLVGASLLMEGFDEDEKAFVSMHDVVREMALWIASDLGKQKEAFIVRACVGLCELPKVKNWNVVKRMSLMDNKIQHLVGSPECLELTTLLLQDARLKKISSVFFKYMPKLAVLDLSGNQNLFELPDGISNLVSLQYLNLSHTFILELPNGLQELKKLIHLDLESTSHLQNIAGISSLRNLKVLKLAGSGFLYDCNTVKELEALEHLEILTTSIDHPSLPKQFLSSHMLISRTRSLGISTDTTLESFEISLPEHVDKLRDLTINNCSIPEIKMGKKCSFLSLVKVSIEFCECLRELTFLMFAPNLGSLDVVGANDLEDIINKEKACEVENSGIVPFQKLNNINLADLPELKNIYWSPLPFPRLKEFDVTTCPNLKKLPLNSESGTHGENGLVIRYLEKEWIENVEWEDEATKNRFSSTCEQISEYTMNIQWEFRS